MQVFERDNKTVVMISCQVDMELRKALSPTWYRIRQRVKWRKYNQCQSRKLQKIISAKVGLYFCGIMGLLMKKIVLTLIPLLDFKLPYI